MSSQPIGVAITDSDPSTPEGGEAAVPPRSATGSQATSGAGGDGADRDRDSLLENLTHRDPSVRRRAARDLASSASAPTLIGPLIAVLLDDDLMVRRTAIAALGRVGDARALGPLQALSLSGREDSDARELAGRARELVERRLAERRAASLSASEAPADPDADDAARVADAIRKAAVARKARSWASLRTKLIKRQGRMITVAWALALAVGLWVAWELRLLVRPLYMVLLVRHPALVSIPLLTGGAAFLVHLLVKVATRGAPEGGTREAPPGPPAAAAPLPRDRSPSSLAQSARRGWRRHWRRGRPLLRGPVRSFLLCGALGFFFAAAMTSAWTGAAIYAHNDYSPLTPAMLDGGQVRIKPYDVARRQTENGLNSPTERPTNLHIVKVDGRLVWTSVRDPEGSFRVLTKPTKGVTSLDAISSGSHVTQSGARYDSDFRYGPGMRITDNIRWQVYKKKCYSCDVAEMTGVPTAEGPLIIAPYIRYEGNWFVRRPTFGGVYVVHPDGRIDDLSPEEAARSQLVRESGRVFPEKLARRIADAYKYKRGVWNAILTHDDQLDVADTEENRQPFLQDFEGLGSQWVTTLKPYGQTFTTAGLMTTDAISGKTRVWLAGSDQSLLGNQRALDIVRGESFPGIVFSEREAEDAAGKFRVVEPRQVFPGGRLQFLLSIIPNTASRVTMSVIVDADSQQVVAKFPATPEGDSDLIAYLRSGQPPPEADDESAPSVSEDEQPAPQDSAPSEQGTEPESTLRRVLRENRIEQRNAAGRIADLKAQERDLLRVLRAADEKQP